MVGRDGPAYDLGLARGDALDNRYDWAVFDTEEGREAGVRLYDDIVCLLELEERFELFVVMCMELNLIAVLGKVYMAVCETHLVY